MKKLTLELIGTDRQNVFVPLFVVVGGTHFTYGLTSKQNMAHIYVGTVQGPSPKTSNLSRVEEVSPPSTLESFLQ